MLPPCSKPSMISHQNTENKNHGLSMKPQHSMIWPLTICPNLSPAVRSSLCSIHTPSLTLLQTVNSFSPQGCLLSSLCVECPSSRPLCASACSFPASKALFQDSVLRAISTFSKTTSPQNSLLNYLILLCTLWAILFICFIYISLFPDCEHKEKILFFTVLSLVLGKCLRLRGI